MSKILSTAILAGLMFGLAAPMVQAKDAPKTKPAPAVAAPAPAKK